MRETFTESIKIDLFAELLNDFFTIIEKELIITVETDKGVSFKTNFHDKNIINIEKMFRYEVTKKEKLIHQNLIEFSMEEKFYYLSESLTNYKLHRFNNIEEFSKYVLGSINAGNEVEIFPGQKILNYNYMFLGEIFDSDNNDFKSQLLTNLNHYGSCFFKSYEELYCIIKDIDDQFRKGLLTNESKLEVNEYILKHRPVFSLHPDFKISSIKNGKIRPSKFNKNQIALLIEFLCEYKVFLDFDKQTKAFFASLFTGASEQKIYENLIDIDEIIFNQENYSEIQEIQALFDNFKEFISLKQNEFIAKKEKMQNEKRKNKYRKITLP